MFVLPFVGRRLDSLCLRRATKRKAIHISVYISDRNLAEHLFCDNNNNNNNNSNEVAEEKEEEIHNSKQSIYFTFEFLSLESKHLSMKMVFKFFRCD
jgi:hypothetical protein